MAGRLTAVALALGMAPAAPPAHGQMLPVAARSADSLVQTVQRHGHPGYYGRRGFCR